MARDGLSSKSLREVAAAARSAARQRAAARAVDTAHSDPAAAAVAQRVFNAIREAKVTGEAGDVSPLLWGPLAVAAEMMSAVVIASNGLPDSEEMRIDVAAYFVAGFLSGGHGFDRQHFEDWRTRSVGDADALEPG